jgi:flagellar hook-length control protein FliK
MNATPMNLNPVQAVQAAPQAGKDATSPEVPFSQVLSGEIAQTRKTDAAKDSSDAGTAADPASQAASPAEGQADTTRHARAGEKSTHDRGAAVPEEEDAIAPETLLALAISPDAFRPAVLSPGTKIAATEPAPAAGALAVPALDVGKSRAAPVTQAGEHASDARAARKADPGLPGKDDVQVPGAAARAAAPADLAAARAAASADPAPAFARQLAGARQGDGPKTGEFLPDLTSNPLLRAAPHAPVEVKLASADAAFPHLAPTVGTTAWGQALGDKLVWMAAGAQQTASITLNPPNLGPLQIVLNVTNDQATASFFSAQPEVRQALEAAFPRLREMMNDAGIQLGQATVSADTPQQHDTPDRQAQRIVPPFPGADSAASAAIPAAHAPVLASGRGLVDTFA